MEEIQEFTRLTKEQIEDALKKHEAKDTLKESSKTVKPKVVKKTTEPTMLEVVSLLKDIQGKLNMLLDKVA